MYLVKQEITHHLSSAQTKSPDDIKVAALLALSAHSHKSKLK